MTENLSQRLADGAELKANNGSLSFAAGDSTWAVTAHADALEGVAGRFRELRLERTAGHATRPLAERARCVADRVSGLLEPIVLVEVDDPRQIAQLRSNAPAVTGAVREYYDIAMTGETDVSFTRVRFDADTQNREPVPFTLTYEVLGKLLQDLTAD